MTKTVWIGQTPSPLIRCLSTTLPIPHLLLTDLLLVNQLATGRRSLSSLHVLRSTN
ncbi:MAG: hypothetical protein SFY66_00495 [Oculatellaceae cyanobacterium bins.114]|nr:hypothetical protein [Oculatellaceae cyanobacterium bins.114]